MKTFDSMYLGLCVNNDDPEKRGRVQVFIPHIMPTLYEGWNKDGADIQLNCIGDNLPQGLTADIVERLVQILPWAECASPVLGTSAPGNLYAGNTAAGAQSTIGGATRSAGSGNYYDQSPVPQPIKGAGGGGQTTPLDPNAPGANPVGDSVLQDALKYCGKDARGRQVYNNGFGLGSYTHNCGRGTIAVVGALTGNPKHQTGALGGNAKDFSLAGGMSMDRGSGLYNKPVAAGSDYLNNPSMWRVGDVIASSNSGWGHIQVWTGKAWVSDANQGPKILQNGYNSFALHRLNDAGIAAVNAKWGGLAGAPTGEATATTDAAATQTPTNDTGSQETTSTSNESPAAPAQAECTPPTFQQGVPERQYGNVANQYIDNQASSAAAGVPIDLNTQPSQAGMGGITPGALEYAMRMAAGETGAGINPGNSTAKYINNIENTVAMSQGKSTLGVDVRGKSQSQVNAWGRQIINSGQVKTNKLDIGYTQHNADDMRTYGTQNYGSYKDQILSVARHVQNQANKNPTFQNYLNNRDFISAKNMNGGTIVPGWNTSHYRGSIIDSQNKMTNLISSKYGGDAFAALEAINSQMPSTPKLEDMLAGVGPSTVAGGDTNPAAGVSSAGTGSAAEQAAGNQSVCMVNNTDSHGPSVSQGLNSVAKGVFSYPAPGAMLWIFFREGNPLFPVYFAASYGAAEWQSAYKYSSPGPGYNPVPKNGEPQSTGGFINLNGVGGLRWEDTNNLEDRTKDQKSIMLFGEDGSNIFFGKGFNQYYSKFDRRDQVEGDRWETTLGFKEQWVQGDYNKVVLGDYYLKVGNVSQRAVEAVQQIQEYIKQIQQPLIEGGKNAGGGDGSSGSSSLDGTIAQGANTGYNVPFEGTAGQFDNQISMNLTDSQAGRSNVAGLNSGAQSMNIFGDTGSLAMQRNAPAAGRNSYFNIDQIRASQNQQVMQAGRLAPAAGRNSSFNISQMTAAARGSNINPSNYNTGRGRYNARNTPSPTFSPSHQAIYRAKMNARNQIINR